MKLIAQFIIALCIMFLQIAAVSACMIDQKTIYIAITQTKGK